MSETEAQTLILKSNDDYPPRCYVTDREFPSPFPQLSGYDEKPQRNSRQAFFQVSLCL